MMPQSVRAERRRWHVIWPWSAQVGRWWHSQHDTASERTPLARMLTRVIGSPA
jgi:hypothetical protein